MKTKEDYLIGVQFPASRSPRDFNMVLIAMEEYAQESTKDCYPKEFLRWCIDREVIKTWEGKYYVGGLSASEDKTIDELFTYWKEQIK